MPKNASEKELAAQAAFIFKGTVQRPKASTMRGVQVTDRTSIVRVDEVLKASKMLAAYQGQDITVQSSEKLKKGERAIFYTNASRFGESLMVESIGHTKIESGTTSSRSITSAPDAAEAKLDQQLSHHLTEADVVLKGRVISIRLPADEATSTATQPVSEHSGHWREAVIEVEDVQKGEHATQQVIIRFPSSRDIRWARSPKFEPGQEGIFLLHKEEPQARDARSAAKKRGAEQVYTALHAEDFQPLDRAAEIRSIISLSRAPKSTARKGRR